MSDTMAGDLVAVLACLLVLLYLIVCGWAFDVKYGPSSPNRDDGRSTSASCPANTVMIRCEVDIHARSDGSISSPTACSAYARSNVGSVKAVNVCMYGKNVVKKLVARDDYRANPSLLCPAGFYMFGCNEYTVWGNFNLQRKVTPFLQPDGRQGCKVTNCDRCRLQLHCIEGGVVKRAIHTVSTDTRVKMYTMEPVFGPIPFTLKMVKNFTTTNTFRCCKECLSLVKCDYIIHLTTVGMCQVYAFS